MPGIFAVSWADIRYFPPASTTPAMTIRLNPVVGRMERDAVKPQLKAFPAEIHFLPGGSKAVLRLRLLYGDEWQPLSKVGVVNLQERKLEELVVVGRGGKRTTNFLKIVAVQTAVSAVSMGMAGALMVPTTGLASLQTHLMRVASIFQLGLLSILDQYKDLNRRSGIELASSADGARYFVLNRKTNDITVRDSGIGEANTYIPLGPKSIRLLAMPGSDDFCALSEKKFLVVDTDTSTVKAEYQVTIGRIAGVYLDEDRGQVWVLASDSLLVIDGKTGELEAEVGGLSRPRLLFGL